MLDIARRVHNHNYTLDPYVRSLLDLDFYKLLMLYFIWRWFPKVIVTFTVKNRSKAVQLPKSIRTKDLRAQLDHVRGLSFQPAELIWLQGNTFYGQKGIFPPEFIAWLSTLRLPPYSLKLVNGEYELSFTGTWAEVTLWEIYALAIINEARSRAAMSTMSEYQLRVLYSCATSKLVGKLRRLRDANVPRIAEFGTRRRHGFLWQRFVIEAMYEELGSNFLGTSNAYHAYKMGLNAIGTNAHELPMVMAALALLRTADLPSAEQNRALYESQFKVLELWNTTFGGNLLVALADTFGTTQFLKGVREHFPDIRNWTGFREDSKDPFIGGEEKIAFWRDIGANPANHLQLFSDGLDDTQMVALHQHFDGRILDGYGWGTLATNDMRGCHPLGLNTLDPISVVCKVTSVQDGKGGPVMGAVKLSDNYEKRTGPLELVDRYSTVFGCEGVANVPVLV